MESNVSSSGYVLNHSSSALPVAASGYYQRDNDGNIIDLGLSLRVIPPEIYPSHDDYDVLLDWRELHPQLKNQKVAISENIAENREEEVEAGKIQQIEKRCWRYVKVNMNGVVVGRKICLQHHVCYSSLALQLEDMFGKHTLSGLSLFHEGSEFSLYYKDRDAKWRLVGDVPWTEFVDCVERLRIVHKIQSQPLSFSFTNID